MKLQLKIKKTTTSEHSFSVEADTITDAMDMWKSKSIEDEKKQPICWTNAETKINLASATTVPDDNKQ